MLPTGSVHQRDTIPQLLIIYTNDAVLVEYSDESRLQISPCGSVFQYDYPPGVIEAGSRSVQQRTEFATSSFRPCVQEALTFRNLFATRPFLSSRLLDHDQFAKTYTDRVDTFYWPAHGSQWKLGKETKFTAANSDASVTVSPNGQELSLQYRCNLSDDERIELPLAGERFCQTSLTISLMPEEDLPQCWRVPVRLALGQPFDSSVEYHSSSQLVERDGRQWVATRAPAPLPRRCRQPQLHTFVSGGSGSGPAPPPGLDWLSAAQPAWRPIRVICSDGVVYRLARRRRNGPAVLVQLGDGSVLVSHSPSGEFFARVMPNGERRCHAVQPEVVPTARENAMRLRRALERASALCHLLTLPTLLPQTDVANDLLPSEEHPASCCSEEPPGSVDLLEISPPRPQPPLECRMVPGVGRFSVHTSGRARVVFEDRVQLDYRVRLRPELLPDNPRVVSIAPRDLPPLEFARLLTQQGAELTLSLSEPPLVYEKHARAAIEWAMWLNSVDRSCFYEAEFAPPFHHHQAPSEAAREELQKIRRAVRDCDSATGESSAAGPPDVEATLRRIRRFLGEEAEQKI